MKKRSKVVPEIAPQVYFPDSAMGLNAARDGDVLGAEQFLRFIAVTCQALQCGKLPPEVQSQFWIIAHEATNARAGVIGYRARMKAAPARRKKKRVTR